MSGHNKWSQIKERKGKTDAARSRLFSKLGRLITQEAKKAGGNRDSTGLKAAIERARAANMPNDNIERAIKKAAGDRGAALELVLYEAYGPGGVAVLIETLTDNRNKTSQEIRHILSERGLSLAAPGSAAWAFRRSADGYAAQTLIPLENGNLARLEELVEALEGNADVQAVFTNAE